MGRGEDGALEDGLDGFALEGCFLGVGEGVLCLEGGCGGSGEGFCAGLALGGFFAQCLELLRLAAQTANFYTGWFRDQITHREIFSCAVGAV